MNKEIYFEMQNKGIEYSNPTVFTPNSFEAITKTLPVPDPKSYSFSFGFKSTNFNAFLIMGFGVGRKGAPTIAALTVLGENYKQKNKIANK